jgi:hypothetical protein
MKGTDMRWRMVGVFGCAVGLMCAAAVCGQEADTGKKNYAEMVVEPAKPTEAEIRQQAVKAADAILVLQIDRTSYAMLCETMSLSEAQQGYVDGVYETYRETLKKIRAELGAPLEEMGVVMLSMTREERRGDTEFMLEVSQLINTQMKAAKPRLESAIAMFEASVLEVLAENQKEPWREALRCWRRAAMLNPHGTSDRGRRDLAVQVDLIELLEAQGEEDRPELARWFAPGLGPDDLSIEEKALRVELGDVLAGYAVELDAKLQASFWRDREESMAAMPKLLLGDMKASERHRKRVIERWMVIYRLNRTTIAHLAARLDEAGHGSEAALVREAIERAYFARTWQPKSADLMYAWLTEQESMSAEQLEVVRQAYESELSSRSTMRRELGRVLIDIANAQTVMPYLVGVYRDVDWPHPDVVDVLERLKAQNDRILDAFRGMLTAEQLAAFKAKYEQNRHSVVDGAVLEF